MTRFRAVLCFMLVAAVILCGSAFAGKAGTHSESMLSAHDTTNQVAIMGAFLSCVPDPSGGAPAIDTALSFSNITANPGGMTSYYDPARTVGEVDGLSGGMTAYLYADTGDVAVVELPITLDSGQTGALLLCDALGGASFSGYAWVVADFGAVTGTVTNLWNVYGIAGTTLMEPALGGVPMVSGDEVEPH